MKESAVNEATGIAAPVFDPFQYSVDLPHQIVLFPLGCEMRLRTNSREIVQAMDESWSGFPSTFSGTPLDLRVVVSDDLAAPSATGLMWRAQGHLLAMQSDQNNF